MPVKKKTDQPLILFISDIHCGSTVGLMPEVIETKEGQIVRPNKFQNWMLDHWHKDWKDFQSYRNGRPFWLVLVGDLIEGIHHGGKQVWSPEAFDHSVAALALLQPIAEEATKTFLVKGTECHTREDEMAIGKVLKSVKCPETGHHAWDTVSLKIGSHLIQVRHHMPTTGRVYLEASALSITLGNTQLSYARHKQPIPDIVVSGHRHRCGWYADDESMMMACPAWQGLTRHGHKVVPGALPKVGFCVMDWVRGTGNLPYGFRN